MGDMFALSDVGFKLKVFSRPFAAWSALLTTFVVKHEDL
jgi:hypothetical protein